MAEQAINLNYIIDPFEQFMNLNGKPLVGGYITLYLAGTNEKYISYQNFDYTQNPFKVPINSDGRVTILVDVSQSYDAYVYSSNGNLVVSRLNLSCPGGVAGGGLREVIHDETMTGKGTQLSPLGVSPLTNLAVDETMTAYEATVEGKDSLVLGVNGDWFYNQFGSAFSGKVDLSAFNSAYSGLMGDISSKADWSALNNYYTKNETYNNFLPRSAIDLNNYYTKDEVFNKNETNIILGFKEDKLDFGYNDSSAISSINGSALAGQGGGVNCPWISGSKVIADTQTLTSNMIIQILSSFDLSGYKNHNIGMKGGTYRFPDEYEIGSALLHTNYFMHLSGMSAYLPQSAFSSYTDYANGRMDSIFQLANSAYTTAVNNFYNKLDASSFSSYSAGQDSTINNITEQITNISNASGNWNDISSYQQNSANYLTAINIPESANWNEATNVVQSNSSNWNNKLDLSAFENASGNFYPMTGNPSGFINDLSNYYQKNETSSKGEIADALSNIPQGDPNVNSFVQTNSSTIVNVDNVVTTNSGLWLTAHQAIPSAKWENASDVVQANSAQWAENTGDTEVNNYVYNNSGINNEVNNVVTANSGVWNNVTNKLDTTAFTAWSASMASADYELSAGEGISITDDVQNKKTIITNNISAGTNISLVYDQETNKIRIDSEGGTTLTGDAQGAVDKVYVNSGNWISTINNDASALFFAKKVVQGNSSLYGPVLSANANAWNDNSNYKFQIRAATLAFGFDDQYSHCSSFYTPTAISSRSTSNGMSVGNWDWHLDYRGLGGTFSDDYENVATWSALRNVDIGLTTGGTISSISGHSLDGKTYTGVAPIQVNNTSNEISITGESLSAGPGIDLFESGGYVVISSNGGNTFPMTGTDGTANFTANANFSSFTLTTGQGAAGCYVNLDAKNVRYEAYPSTDISASWHNIITATNNRSNCYCIRFTDDMTAADLANYSAYDKVTVVHSNEYAQDCHLYWDGKTKVFPSGLYCEMVRGKDDQNNIKWSFAQSGWVNENWWDWD